MKNGRERDTSADKPASLEVISSTRRILGVLILASALMSLGLFGVQGAGYMGVALVLAILGIRIYSVIAVLSLANSSVSTRVEGDMEGKPIKVTFHVCNNSSLPIALVEFTLQYPEYLKISRGSPGGIAILPPRGCFTYEVEFTGRIGTHTIGPLNVIYRDVFGLFKSPTLTIGDSIKVTIYPRIEEKIVSLALSSSRSAGLARSRRSGEGVEFYSVREYAPGDEIRRIYWKALAKGRLAVKEYERESTLYTLFMLVIDEHMGIGPYLNTPLEHSVRIIGALVSYLSRRNDYVALSIIAPNTRIVTEFARGKRAYIHVRRLMSSLSFDFTKLNRETSESAIASQLSAVKKEILRIIPRDRVNIIIVSTPKSAPVVGREIRSLYGIKGINIFFFILLPHLYGLEKLSGLERALYRVRTYQLTREAREVVKSLRGMGYRALLVTPWDMASRIVKQLEYLR